MKQAMYIIKVKSNSDITSNFVLFGCDRHLSSDNHGSDKNVSVSPLAKNVSYLQLLHQSKHQPIEVNRIKIYSSNSSQRKNTLTISSSDLDNTSMCSMPIIPLEYISYENEAIGIVDIPVDIHIDGSLDISSEIYPNTEAIFMFYGKVIDNRSFIKKISDKLYSKLLFLKFRIESKRLIKNEKLNQK